MALVFCVYCGNHDVCPNEMGGNDRCDMCGRPGIPFCGECSTCAGIEESDEDEEYLEDE